MDIISVDWREAAISRAFVPLLEPPYLTFHRVYNDFLYPRHLYQEKNTSSSIVTSGVVRLEKDNLD